MNTENKPQTFLEVPGLCSSIMKLPRQPIVPLSEFHDQLMAAKNKAQVIDIICIRGSQTGWVSDMPDGLYDKLQGLRSSPQKQ